MTTIKIKLVQAEEQIPTAWSRTLTLDAGGFSVECELSYSDGNGYDLDLLDYGCEIPDSVREAVLQLDWNELYELDVAACVVANA